MIGLTVSLGTAIWTLDNAPGSPTSASLEFVAPSSDMFWVRFGTSRVGNNGPTIDNITLAAVPEPGVLAMLLGGFGLLAFGRKRA